jgi:hypothetical protein
MLGHDPGRVKVINHFKELFTQQYLFINIKREILLTYASVVGEKHTTTAGLREHQPKAKTKSLGCNLRLTVKK